MPTGTRPGGYIDDASTGSAFMPTWLISCRFHHDLIIHFPLLHSRRPPEITLIPRVIILLI